jgi:hypothetical protein
MGAAFADVVGQRDAEEGEFEERKNPFSPSAWKQLFRDLMNQSIYYGSGKTYYESQVDENSKKKLGVYLENIDRRLLKFTDNEKIVIDAVLTAENFDIEDGAVNNSIGIDLSCTAFKGEDEISQGRIYPKSHYEIENFDVENIQCIFEPWQLETGRYDVKFYAKFDFETHAYLKRYFVLQGTIDSLKRRRIIDRDEEILKINDISDSEPYAMNSVGPVKIESSERFPYVIKLNSGEESVQIFSLQLSNAWSGRINRIRDLKIFLPEGIEIEEGECRFSMIEGPLPDYEKYDGYVMYKLAEIRNSALQDVSEDISQSCGISIKAENIDKVLQTGDVTTRYIRMIAAYDYELEQSASIKVSEDDSLHVKILSSHDGPLDSGSVAICKLKDNVKMDGEASFKLYADDFDQASEEGSATCYTKECDYVFEKRYAKDTRIKCEAILNDDESRRVVAFTEVVNSKPRIEKIKFFKEEVDKGENLECRVETSDEDGDRVIVRFDFEGINIAATQKECANECSVEIPTDSVDENVIVKCGATAYDDESVSESKYARAEVNYISEGEV